MQYIDDNYSAQGFSAERLELDYGMAKSGLRNVTTALTTAPLCGALCCSARDMSSLDDIFFLHFFAIKKYLHTFVAICQEKLMRGLRLRRGGR